VLNGAVRSHKLLSDGRRQIGSFHLAGDIFGLENGSIHRFTTEAIVDTTVRLMKRRSLEHVAETDVLVAMHLLNMTTANLQHAEDHMLLLGRKTSLERVAAFLLEMDRRLTAADVIALPMSRRDIADYLGLTLETVSRALSHLNSEGMIGFNGQTHRQIVLIDRRRLAELDV
jgi:CRP/FNR family transcriptional regulator, nitrogen fixation regulation protein